MGLNQSGMGKSIVAFGEIVWDMLPQGNILGGTPLNLVFRVNSFGEDGHLLSRVGNDELGEKALEKLVELGISDKDVQMDYEFSTGEVKVTFEKPGETKYEVKPDVAFDHIEFTREALELAREAKCLFYGLLPQRYGLSKNTIRELMRESSGSLHFFDLKLFQHFFDTEVVEHLLSSTNVVRIKEREASFLAEKLALDFDTIETFSEQLAEKYKVDLVIVTRGKYGIFAHHLSEGKFYEAGYDVDVVDNVGSGMAFSAGFLHYFLNGKSIAEALAFGNAAGALNTTKTGATTVFSKQDVLNFMKIAKRVG